MHRTATAFIISLLSLSSLGCNLLSPEGCDAFADYGLLVMVRNAQTDAPAGAGAVVTATDGSYAETLVGFDGLNFSGAMERAGVYAIAVNAPGYQPWTRQNVEVKEDGCHVDTQTVDARLQPVGN